MIDGYGKFILKSFKGFDDDKPTVFYKTADENILFQTSHDDSLYSLAPEEGKVHYQTVSESPYRNKTVDDSQVRYKRYTDVVEQAKNAPTFSDVLIKTQNMLGLKAPEVYKTAGIDYRHYSKIISDKNYKPKKETVFALALALKLNDYATEQFLKYAGYSFNPSSLFDMTIKYFIDEKIYDRLQIDLLMDSMNLPLLPQNW